MSSGVDGYNVLTSIIVKGNVKRLYLSPYSSDGTLVDNKGTATFIYGTNSVTRTNIWILVDPSQGGAVYMKNVDNVIPIGGYVCSTNNPTDGSIEAGLRFVAQAQFPPATGLIDGTLVSHQAYLEVIPTKAQVSVVCANPPRITLVPNKDGTFTVSCPTNTTFQFGTLYGSDSLGKWTALTNKASIAGTNRVWTVDGNGNNFFKVGL
jgi:hypothetical protein